MKDARTGKRNELLKTRLKKKKNERSARDVFCRGAVTRVPLRSLAGRPSGTGDLLRVFLNHILD